MAKKQKRQRAVVFDDHGGRKHTFVVGGPDAGDYWYAAAAGHAVKEARELVRRMGGGPYHLEGFTAEEEAAIRLDSLKRAGNPKGGDCHCEICRAKAMTNKKGHCRICGESLPPGEVICGHHETQSASEGHYREDSETAHYRAGNPHHLLQARNELTSAFGRPTGGNADWINSAWFVQGSGGSVNPNRPDVHPGLYATHSLWVVEQPEDSEYCVILRDIDEKAGETMDTELMCGPAAGIHSVIDAARSYAAGGLVGGRKGNPVLSSSSEEQPVVLVIWSKPIGRGYRADMRQYDGPLKMRALRAAVKKATRSGDQGGGLALAKSHPTHRMYSPIGEEGVPLLRVRAEDVAIDPTRHAPIQGADGNFYYDDDSRGRIHLDAKTSEFLAEFKRQAQPDRQTNPVMPQFGSSVTPALQGLVRDVTGKACYQETCFVSDGHDGHAPPRA